MAKKRDFAKNLEFLLFVNLAVLVLLLSIFNLTIKPKTEVKVLGVATDNTYWEEMVIKHPTYRDAWIELGIMDKVKQIDPNY
ncbi:MAG: hypothetical protein ACD_19C00015G0004 [uncultured bacterium]|nr:MAG: hypothetical protein ACD_19C00015G0004 [uncultured bacterium]